MNDFFKVVDEKHRKENVYKMGRYILMEMKNIRYNINENFKGKYITIKCLIWIIDFLKLNIFTCRNILAKIHLLTGEIIDISSIMKVLSLMGIDSSRFETIAKWIDYKDIINIDNIIINNIEDNDVNRKSHMIYLDDRDEIVILELTNDRDFLVEYRYNLVVDHTRILEIENVELKAMHKLKNIKRHCEALYEKIFL